MNGDDDTPDGDSGELLELTRKAQQQAVQLVKRLRGRAETCRGNARTYTASMYLGEALRQSERAAAYDLAADDAAELLEVVP
jgi:hypothetical protein